MRRKGYGAMAATEAKRAKSGAWATSDPEEGTEEGGSNPRLLRDERRANRKRRPTDTEWGKPDDWEDGEGGEAEPTCAASVGQGCAWCLINHTDIPLFFLSFIILYLSINRCCYCVVVVAIVSALMCMRFPLLNATLWSALIVLYLHKDWNLNFGNVKVSWNRST